MKIEDKIKRKGLELGFSHVGIAPLRDYPEIWEEVLSRPDYNTFTQGDSSLFYRLAHAKTLHPNAHSVVCATLGYGCVDFPQALENCVARTYLSRKYTPPAEMRYGAVIEAFVAYLEELGLGPDRNRFAVPERLACAEAGIISYGRNNFAYTPEDGSFNILITFIVEAELVCDEPTVRCDCPPDCKLCEKACPTGAIMGPRRLNAQRCILFNHQRFAPGAQQEIWDSMGVRIHGCDACQLACPRNHGILARPKERDLFLDALDEKFDLEKVLLLDDEYYEDVVYPIMYNYIRDRDIFRRNAAVALGNTGDPSHIPALREARETTDNEHVRIAIDFALKKLGDTALSSMQS